MSQVASAVPSVAPRSTARMGRLAAASMIGTTLEWYDFTVYNTMAALIFNRLFFPSFDPLAGVILAFSTYAVGYLSRPFGGVIFGRLGDKLGRRVVLVVTLVIMGFCTAGMGMLPTYAAVGVLSPILLVTLRFVQGVALGGEWAGAVLLAMEHGSQSRRGLNASWTQVGPSAGTLIATGVITVVTTLTTDATFTGWAWRLPFLMSLVLVGFGLWLRSGVDETPMFLELEAKHEKVEAPVGDVLRHHWRSLLISGGSRVGADVHYGMMVVFTLTYVTVILHMSRTLALTAVLVGAAFNAVTILLAGALSDRWGRRPVYALGTLGAAIFAFAYYPAMDTKVPAIIIASATIGLILHAIMYGPQAAFITEQFATPVRYTGASLAYTFAGVVGGGFAPLIIVSLFSAYHSTTPISLYVEAALAVTAVCLLVAKETANRPLKE